MWGNGCTHCLLTQYWVNLRVLDQEHYQILHLAENKILDHSINNNEKKKKVYKSMGVIKLILREKNKDDIFYYVESHK